MTANPGRCVQCDSSGCDEEFHVLRGSEPVRALRDAGWFYTQHVQLCPTHRPPVLSDLTPHGRRQVEQALERWTELHDDDCSCGPCVLLARMVSP